ncbi:50S ribosomal protein L11 methyltransferase [Chelativorans sp. YIM 93263]|uniref:50S ribosomal protein L11 methyltransferase n=1 Tax=Chelativorans sp. YIM 93263 TaxID=2906648 RepID=UPI0023784A4F|nr:50S ribosomal protein L11 methyltransferase [Chelativorans sp. YIM 93263]
MPQIRFYFQYQGALARRAYEILESEFEDDGLAIATFEVDEENDVHEISAYAIENSETIRERIANALAALPEQAEIMAEELPDVDWVALSLEGLHAVRAGRFLVHGAHERNRRRPGEIGIEIEAGLAFGTGHHGTTAGCLEMLEQVVRRERPRNALDLGTGSAVLAIAMAKLARTPTLATDIDPVATSIAEGNARVNEVGRLISAATASGFHHPAFATKGPFDLIVANILANPLMKLAPGMARHLAPQGSLILSGILDRQRRAVIAAYVNQGFRHMQTLHRDGWATLHLKR